MYYRQVFVLLKCKLTNKIRNDKKSRPNCEEIKRHFSKIKRRFISLKRRFVRLKRRFVFLKNSNCLTLLPFPCDYFKVSFTRGDAYALPGAKFFWAFGPRVVQRGNNLPPRPEMAKAFLDIGRRAESKLQNTATASCKLRSKNIFHNNNHSERQAEQKVCRSIKSRQRLAKSFCECLFKSYFHSPHSSALLLHIERTYQLHSQTREDIGYSRSYLIVRLTSAEQCLTIDKFIDF